MTASAVQSRSLRRLLAGLPGGWVVVIAFVLVAATALGVLLVADLGARAAAARDREVVAVARTTATALLTLDAGTAPEVLARLQAASTGAFKQDLVAQAAEFSRAVSDTQVAATGEVREAGIRSATDTEATVLVSAAGLVRNAAAPDGVPRRYRLAVHLQRDAQSGAWLVSDVEFAS